MVELDHHAMADELEQNLVAVQKQGGESVFTTLFRLSEHWGYTALAVVLLVVGWLMVAPADRLAAEVPEEAVVYVHVRKPTKEVVERYFLSTVQFRPREVAQYALLKDGELTWYPLAAHGGYIYKEERNGNEVGIVSKKISFWSSKLSRKLQSWRYHFGVTGFVTDDGVKQFFPDLDNPLFNPGERNYFGVQSTNKLVYAAVAEKPTHVAGLAAFVRGLLAGSESVVPVTTTMYGTTTSMPMFRLLRPDWFAQANKSGLSSLKEFQLAEKQLNQSLADFKATGFESAAGPEIYVHNVSLSAVSKSIIGSGSNFPDRMEVEFEDGVVVEEFRTIESGLAMTPIDGGVVMINIADGLHLNLLKCGSGAVMIAQSEPICPTVEFAKHMHSARGITFPIPELALEFFPQLQKFSTASVDQIVDNFVTVVLN